MAAFKFENFGGQIPRTTPRALPLNHASQARNTKLLSGAITPIREPLLEYDFADTSIVKAWRIPDPDTPGDWVWHGEDKLDYDVHRGPLLNDQYERYYKFGGGEAPKYNSAARIKSGGDWYDLGVPPPATAPTVGTTGGAAANVTRFYVYTWVTGWGEESAPSPVSASHTGPEDATWNITAMEGAAPAGFRPGPMTKNLYRTVVGYQESRFFRVATGIPEVQTVYADTDTDENVSQNPILESEDWVPPPADIEGAVLMANGFFVGWAGNDLHFSEPYRPHAWPAKYDLSVEFDIVGLGVWGQSLAVATQGNPYTGTGVAPQAVTLTKANTVEPCLSRYGIVDMPFGVMYPTQNGLVLVGPQGVTLATRSLLTEQIWKLNYSPETLLATKFGSQYLGFYSPDDGYMLDPQEPNAAFVEFDWFENVDNIQTDPYTGEVYIMRGGQVEWWDDENAPPGRWLWRSKLVDFARPTNFGMGKIDWQCTEDLLAQGYLFGVLFFNRERILTPLSSLGDGAALGSSYSLGITVPPPFNTPVDNRQPLGGSPLLPIDESVRQLLEVTFRLYDECGNLLFERVITDGEQFRMPSGFKKENYFFEVEGYRDIYTVKLGETGKDLRQV